MTAAPDQGADPARDPAPETTDRTARPRVPARRTVVLLGVAAAAALAGSTRPVWVTASAPDLTGSLQQVPVSGAEAAPAVTALALVALAAALATSLSAAWLRLLTGPVLILSGLGAAVAAVGATRAPAEASRSAVTGATGVAGTAVEAAATTWPLLSLVPAALVVATGVLMLAVGGRWPRRTRYRSAAVAATADPADDPAAAWDALTRGEDPTLGPGEDSEEGLEDGADGPDDAPAACRDVGPDRDPGAAPDAPHDGGTAPGR